MSTLLKDESIGVELEEAVPDYYNDDFLDNPKTIYRIDDNGTRWYYELNEDFYPTFYGSVTTVKSAVSPTPRPIINKEIQLGTKDYRSYVTNRQQFGTFFHREAARLAIDGGYDFDNLNSRINFFANGYNQKDISGWKARIGKSSGEYSAESLVLDIMRSISNPPVEYTNARHGKYSWNYEAMRGLLAWLQFIRDYEVTFIGVELPLSHPDGYAGTLDYYIERNKVKYTEKTPQKNRKRIREILDIKTGGIYEGNEIQLELNKRTFHYHYPNMKVDRLSNWTYRENSMTTPYYVKNQTGRCSKKELDSYINIWKQKTHQKPRDINKVIGRVKVGEPAIKRYETTPIEEFIKEKHKQLQ